jgi:hypothetical protein
MKIAFVLAACAAVMLVFIWQRSDARSRAASDATVLAGLQAKYDAALQENRALKQALQKQSANRGALATAMPIATRYRALEKKK